MKNGLGKRNAQDESLALNIQVEPDYCMSQIMEIDLWDSMLTSKSPGIAPGAELQQWQRVLFPGKFTDIDSAC